MRETAAVRYNGATSGTPRRATSDPRGGARQSQSDLLEQLVRPNGSGKPVEQMKDFKDTPSPYAAHVGGAHGSESAPFDRAAMIEAASRSLRQRMARPRELPRSKGSARADPRPERQDRGEPRSAENAQRRMRSAENEHRASQRRLSAEKKESPADLQLEDGDTPQPFEDPVQLGELKRPLSRKKDPSASAAAGLGAFASPVRVTDAFEQRKTRRPIPIESWGPRPPSRHGMPTKCGPLEGDRLQDSLGDASSPRPRGRQHDEGADRGERGDRQVGGTWAESTVGGTWAAARASAERGTERRPGGGNQTRNGPARSATEQDLGVFGCSTGGTPAHRLSTAGGARGALESRGMERTGSVGGDSGGAAPWPMSRMASGMADVDPGELEVSGWGLGGGGGQLGASWPLSQHTRSTPPALGHHPANNTAHHNAISGLSGTSPPTRQGQRSGAHHEAPVSVEDVEEDLDLGLHVSAYRRDATPPQVIVTNSRAKEQERTPSKRARERGSRGSRNMPFSTSLDNDFLSLFAS
jgi:hypothetical protein